ncbi:hypothetical protein CTEN210_09133 [Chaetoceros tenuissimus]|uniref:Uncharacterized protein n=1 Tax=Chaetoceros tenuissimus TaxID=426638 RepID=A0AAD3CV73_9STRA|nr:hypothetical protein CTEN210_09133 [Chaetoceros tenuissimus]
MGKKSSRSSSNWSAAEHNSRLHKKIDKQNESSLENTSKLKKGYHRSAHLSHDNYEKRQESKLRLHISKVKRELDSLKKRLVKWDDLSEHELVKKQQLEAQKKRQREELESQPNYKKPRKGRLGPETWKLKGAARPAWEVYDFDTRYVCPHLKAHQEALEKYKRSINAMVVCKGFFGKFERDDGSPVDYSKLLIDNCRHYLSLLMQLALLALEAKKYKTARESFLEILDLEGYATLNPITNARCRLMRMYLEANRPDSARRLWEKLPVDYSSVWIRYNAALLEYVSWNILKEPGSSQTSATSLLIQAIRSNVYCAYMLAFHETFHQVMEYTEDVEDAPDASLEQAIEYCNSDAMGDWAGTDGALEWIKEVILNALNSNGTKTGEDNSDGNIGENSDEEGDAGNQQDNEDSSSDSDNDSKEVEDVPKTIILTELTKQDLEWEEKLAKAEKEYEEAMEEEEEENGKEQSEGDGEIDNDTQDIENGANGEEEDEEEEEVDFLMYCGMFRTGMDMLCDNGAFSL